MENMAMIMNSTPNAAVKIPQTKYLIKKNMEPKFKHEVHIKCGRCSNYIASLGSEIHCKSCNKIIKTSDSNYFFYIPIEQQILESIQNHIDDILSYDSFICKQNEMNDIQNSRIYKNLKAKHPDSILLPFIINTDGVKVFKSNRKSMWLIQGMQGWLPPSIRFYPTNIMIIASVYGESKIDMKDFFFPFLQELCQIHQKGGIQFDHEGKTWNFMPIVFSCCCDLPAKSEVQGMTGHSGYYACGFCMHPGIAVPGKKKNVIRYVKGTDNYEPRSHSQMIQTYLRKTLKTETIKGVKTISCMVGANGFDMIYGFSIDYMHGVLGIVKKMMSLWLDTENHKNPYYMKKEKQTLLSKRLVKIKPISEILRKPRSVVMKADFKASEYRSLLYYYLYFAIDGLLDAKYVKHFRLLSSVVYSLSKKEISNETIEQAKLSLNKFANDYETLYGKSAVTINLHYARHLAMQVDNLGPLWSQSAFAFEANNGLVVKSITGTKDILHQLTWKYVMKKSTKTTCDDSKKDTYTSLGKEKVIKIPSNEIDLIEQEFGTKNSFIPIFKHVHIRGIKYTSKQMNEISTIDYFVSLKDGQMGAIKYFTIHKFTLYALIDIYTIIDTYDHFFQIKCSEHRELVKITHIKEKCLYLKFGQREYVTCIPNAYEKT